MKLIPFIAFLFFGVFAYNQGKGNVYFVAPDGDDKQDGTKLEPWGTWQKAVHEAQPGDTVYFRGGIYYTNERVNINPEDGYGFSGTSDGVITYAGYPPDIAEGNMPILDCRYHCDSSDIRYNSAINIWYSEHLYFKDLEIKNVFQCDSVLNGAITAVYSRNLHFERLKIHDIGQRGFYIQGGAWLSWYEDDGTETEPYWTDNSVDTTRFINCDVYNLCDSITNANGWDPGNGADAWKLVHYGGNYLEFEGCRAWDYTDDMLDPSMINGGRIVVNNCWAMPGTKYDNLVLDGQDISVEQNGIKLSSTNIDTNAHVGIVTNCLSMFGSTGVGFSIIDKNPYRGNHVFYNNTSYYHRWCFNGTGRSTADYPRTEIFRNNLAYHATTKTATGDEYLVALSSDDDAPYPCSNNTWYWDIGYPSWEINDTFTVSAADFVTLDSTTLVSLFTAPRNPDGSLPDQKPLMLIEDSDLIDAGKDVGMAFRGDAPDIGYDEYGTLSVEIIDPLDGAALVQNDEITIKAKAEDTGGMVSRVEFFYRDTTKNLIGTVNSEPWFIEWTGAPIGNHILRAVAINDRGETATSAEVQVSVILDDISIPEKCIVIPNPNNGKFTIYLKDAVNETSTIEVISLEGKVVFKDIIANDNRFHDFDLMHLHSGLYIISVWGNDGSLTCKSIINRELHQ